MSKRKRAKRVSSTAPQWILLVIFIAYEIFAIIFATAGIHTSVSLVAAGIYSILEVLLSICLFRTPVYVHGLVFIGQLILGNVCRNLPLMVIFAILYLISVILLYYWTRDEKERHVYVKKDKVSSKAKSEAHSEKDDSEEKKSDSDAE